MKYPMPIEPHTNEAKRKLAVNIKGSGWQEKIGSGVRP
jgi:hypothetical protein